VRPAILAKIWKPLGRMPELLDMLLDTIIATASASPNGLVSEETASMADAGTRSRNSTKTPTCIFFI